jgi:short-subunit dehydrogenase
MLSRQGGRIVNITSIRGKISVPHLLPYCCAKFAAVALSEGLHAELKSKGISVTTVVPGLMRTASHLNALFKGNRRGEYAWFGPSAVLPPAAMSAERAARRIVEAARRRETELILGVPAKMAARLQGLFPEKTRDVIELLQRLLPDGDQNDDTVQRGIEVQKQMGPTLRAFFDLLGRLARPADKNEIRTPAETTASIAI